MAFEETQKGNPYRLVKNQHVFPKKSIKRFSGSDGMVHVYIGKAKKWEALSPSNNIFCAKRAWDQKSEELGKSIEDNYQCLVDSILSDEKSSISFFDSVVITKMYALWVCRSNAMNWDFGDVSLPGVEGDFLTKNEQEKAEFLHMAYCLGEKSEVPGRFIVGDQIQLAVNNFCNIAENAGLQWRLHKTTDIEIAVPDNPSKELFIPMSKKLFLSPYKIISTDNFVEKHNWWTVLNYKKYFFVNDFSKCFSLFV